jgi:hypothetical protein
MAMVSVTSTAPASVTSTVLASVPAILSIIHVAADHTVSSVDKLYVPWGSCNIVSEGSNSSSICVERHLQLSLDLLDDQKFHKSLMLRSP